MLHGTLPYGRRKGNSAALGPDSGPRGGPVAQAVPAGSRRGRSRGGGVCQMQVERGGGGSGESSATRVGAVLAWYKVRGKAQVQWN